MSRARQAIVLAAGAGQRLRSVVDDCPKGLVEIDGETLVGRSVRLLRRAGIERVTIVAGYRAEDYQRFAAGQPDLRVVLNDRFATTGSMASLDVALASIDENTLVLESDIVYEARALEAILDAPHADATIISGPTAAGDEVWVSAPDGRLRAMSKRRETLATIDGELVGITRVSARGRTAMRDAFARFVRDRGHARMDYETDALVAISADLPVAAILVSDLCWGEIDDERQLERVRGLLRGPLARECVEREP
jgi:choline kinase